MTAADRPLSAIIAERSLSFRTNALSQGLTVQRPRTVFGRNEETAAEASSLRTKLPSREIARFGNGCRWLFLGVGHLPPPHLCRRGERLL